MSPSAKPKLLEEVRAALRVGQSQGSASEKLAALDSATFLSRAFRATEQGREAKKILIELNKDTELRKEISAKRLYDQFLKKSAGTPERQADLLRAVGKRFPGTYYAELAESADLAGFWVGRAQFRWRRAKGGRVIGTLVSLRSHSFPLPKHGEFQLVC